MSTHAATSWVKDDGWVRPKEMRNNLTDDSEWIAVGIEDEDG
jgi:hypothetical protein